MKIIGIGGGSGSGKSTVSYMLVDSDPSRLEVINLDDYQKLKSDVGLPMVGSIVNWDHPDIIRWSDLRRDIIKLQRGESVELSVWAHRSNPDYVKHRQMIPRKVYPRPFLIIEGYLALHRNILDVYDQTFFLELDDLSRAQRRRDARGGKDNIIGEKDYVNKVLKPMHAQHVEPTKKDADLVIDVSNKSAVEVVKIIRDNIKLAEV